MTAKRLAAVLVAVLLVAGAFVVRRQFLDDDSPAGPTQATSVVCITELSAACDALAGQGLAVSVRDAGETLDALATLADPADAPVWITVAPYPAMVDSLRRANGLPELSPTMIGMAHSELVLAVSTEGRAEALATTCGTGLVFECVVEHVGDDWSDIGGESSWGTVRPSFGEVAATATGLIALAAATTARLGTDEVGRDQLGQAGFITWIRGFTSAAGRTALSGGTPLATMITRPSALDVAATTEAEIVRSGEPAARFAVLYPESGMSLQAVAAVPLGSDLASSAVDEATRAVIDDGWTAEAGQAAVSSLSATTLLAVRSFWMEAT
ncbi:hypothetical protein BH24ACT5_BH24ACT5_23740 [soil metagenome]